MIHTPTTCSLTTCLSFSASTHHAHLSLCLFCSGKLSMSTSMHSTRMWQLQVCATPSSQTSTDLLCAITLSFHIIILESCSSETHNLDSPQQCTMVLRWYQTGEKKKVQSRKEMEKDWTIKRPQNIQRCQEQM